MSNRKKHPLCPGGNAVRTPPPPPPRPTLGRHGQFPYSPDGDQSTDRPGTISYINYAHLWYLVTFDDGRRQCYHFGEV